MLICILLRSRSILHESCVQSTTLIVLFNAPHFVSIQSSFYLSTSPLGSSSFETFGLFLTGGMSWECGTQAFRFVAISAGMPAIIAPFCSRFSPH